MKGKRSIIEAHLGWAVVLPVAHSSLLLVAVDFAPEPQSAQERSGSDTDHDEANDVAGPAVGLDEGIEGVVAVARRFS